MDDLDRKIISLLEEDGTATKAAIARRLGVSESTVRRRLKKMVEDENVKEVLIRKPNLRVHISGTDDADTFRRQGREDKGRLAAFIPNAIDEYVPPQIDDERSAYDSGFKSGYRTNIREPLQQRIDSINRYFKLKAADVFEDDESVSLLVKLYQEVSLRYSEVGLDEQAKALARLAAAGFCELGENRFQITETGKRFIDRINESQD